MVFLKMKGGAGNQFSQYAFARALISKRGDKDELYIDYSGVYTTAGNAYIDDHLKWFQTYPYTAVSKEPSKWIFIRMARRVMKMLSKDGNICYEGQKLLCRRGLYSVSSISCASIVSARKNIYIEGNYENSKYYDKIRNILLKEFKLRPQYEITYDIPLINQIKRKESMCVSVRKWPDFEVSEKRKQLTEAFYQSAIDWIIQKTGNDDMQIIIFSDDISYCRSMDFGHEVYFEEGSNTVIEKMHMMCMCQHFVLSNSTFSWWVQYLAENENKTVVMPYCPGLGFFQYMEEPAGVRKENWVVLDAVTGNRVRG